MFLPSVHFCGSVVSSQSIGSSRGAGWEEPLTVETPGDLFREADAIGIDSKEGIVLRSTEGKCVDAHFARTVPVAAAGVITDALKFENAGAKMSDRVAAE